jgi:hypothetical protein
MVLLHVKYKNPLRKNAQTNRISSKEVLLRLYRLELNRLFYLFFSYLGWIQIDDFFDT